MAKQPTTFESPYARYVVVDVLGEGGAGRVFEVQDADGGDERYALKVLHPDNMSRDKLKRFRNELAFCEQDRHPQIVKVLDYGFTLFSDDKALFYVMRKHSHTLRRHMKSGMHTKQKLEVFSKLLDGVEAAHLLGVVHRDIKPENVLTGADPTDLVLADFGIAHFERDHLIESVKTRDTSRLANFQYAAPEQRQRGAPVDRRADIFALGLILNELFTQELAQGEGYKKVVDVTPEYEWLDEVVAKMIQQDPNKRFQSIEEIKLQLIGRRQEFVRRQKFLDEKNKIVGPASAALEIEDVRIIGHDYDNNVLHLVLSSAPDPMWFRYFLHNPGSRPFIMGSEPETFRLSHDTLSVSVTETSAVGVKNLAAIYVQQANAGYKVAIADAAKQREHELRLKQQEMVDREEQRLRVLKMLNES